MSRNSTVSHVSRASCTTWQPLGPPGERACLQGIPRPPRQIAPEQWRSSATAVQAAPRQHGLKEEQADGGVHRHVRHLHLSLQFPLGVKPCGEGQLQAPRRRRVRLPVLWQYIVVVLQRRPGACGSPGPPRLGHALCEDRALVDLRPALCTAKEHARRLILSLYIGRQHNIIINSLPLSSFNT